MTGGSSGSSNKDGPTLRCSSLVVLSGGHANANSAKSESLPARERVLSLSKSAGVLAGHKWSIRHEDLDYNAFRRDNGRYLSSGSNNDHGIGTGRDEQPRLLVIQTKPTGGLRDGGTWRKFECHLPSSASSGHASSTKQIAAFVAALVKMHDKWRAKHPRMAQRLDGGGAGGATTIARALVKKQQQGRQQQEKKAVARKRTGSGRHVGVGVGSIASAGSISTGSGKGEQQRKKKLQLLGSHVRKRKAGDMTAMAADADDDVEPMDVEAGGCDVDDDDDEDVEPMDVEEEAEAKSESKTKTKARFKPDLRVDTTSADPEAEAEAGLLLQTAKKDGSGTTTDNTAAAATTTPNTGDEEDIANTNTNTKTKTNSNPNKAKAKTVTPTPTASTASRKEQQAEQQAEQRKGPQPGGILSFFGVASASANANANTNSSSSTAAANSASAQNQQKKKHKADGSTTASAKNKDDDDGDDNDGDAEDANKDENVGGNGDKGDDDDDDDDDGSNGTRKMADVNTDDNVDDGVIDRPNADGSTSPMRANSSSSPSSSSSSNVPPSDTTKTRKNRRRNTAVYGSGRPSASSSRAHGSIDLGLVRSPSNAGGRGGGIGPRSNKRPAAASSTSSSVNEDPFTFDDGKATPTSYLPATDLSSRLMGSPSPSNRSFGRSRSTSSPIKSPGGIFLPTKSPRNATPSRIGPTSSSFERPPGGGRRLGGKELLAQQKRAEEDPLTDEDEYKRVCDQSDEATVDNDEVRSWDANNGGEAPGSSPLESVPATPRVRRTAYESIMPGRLPRSRQGGWSHDDNGSPVRPRGSSISSPRRPPKSWGSSLRATAKKGTGIVREAPYGNFGTSPDSSEAVKNLDDRFGRCEPPAPMEEDGDDLYDTDDEKSRKKMERLANNPYYPPGSRIHNRDRLENEQQSKYFNDEHLSTADSALMSRGPMRGGLGRGNRNRHRSSGRFGGTPYQQRARRGTDDYSHRESWSQMAVSDRKSNHGFFDKRRRNGSGIDRAAERAKDNVATGLRNLGNTCYLNSSLQTLFSVPGFALDLRSTRDLIMAKYDSRHGDESNANLPLTNALIDTAVDLGMLPLDGSSTQPAGEGAGEGDKRLSGHRKNTFANPKELKKVIDALTDWFHGYQQQDAHEAIGYIIDALHDELAGAKKSVTDETSGAKDEDILLPTDKYFRLEFREQNVCVDCGFTSGEITSVHRNLPVAISKDENEPWTVQETLERHFAPETRDLKCEKCPCKKAHHTTRVLKKPGALLLSFKRFVQEMPNAIADHQEKPGDKENENANGCGTDDDVPTLEASAASSAPPVAAAFVMPTIIRSKVRVCLQEQVSLEPFMLKDDDAVDSTSNSNSFDAVGVVHHIGSTPHSGHYTADAARNRDLGLFDDGRLGEGEKKWVTFDDTATTFTDKITVLEGETSQRNTYMALFVAD